jgi:hypothetical protein
LPAGAPSGAFHFHYVTFQKNPTTREWRGACHCGWSMTGTQEDVQTRAATHDLDEVV